MENFFIRYKNPLVLMAILFVQVVALATQVKREGQHASANSGGTRLIRVWTVSAITPFERVVVSTGHFFRRNWSNYIDLHNARKENRELKDEVARLKLEQVRYKQDAEQAQRLQALLGFKQNYVGQIMAAQVVGTSGTEQSRMITIDKGTHDGVKIDMAVITPDGIIGKIKDVFPFSSQVLLINDRDSGAGVILQGSRLQGILRGSPMGELRVSDVMSDESIQVGEQIITSGGDRIYPKGVPVGTVSSVSPDHDNDPFLAIKVKPAADLGRLEEVLVVTKSAAELPNIAGGTNQVRAADILAQRLPSVTKPDAAAKDAATKTGSAKPAASPSPGAAVPLSAQPSAAAASAKPSATPGDAKTSATPVSGPGKPSTAPNSNALNSNAPGVGTNSSPKPASANPASAIPAGPNPAGSKTAAPKTVGVRPTGTASNPDGSPVASPSPTPKPPVKKPRPQATPTPAATNTPEIKPPDTQTPAAETEKPPR
jgi:rod shape-determining protein MreC